jgi:dienelactone hydrolase
MQEAAMRSPLLQLLLLASPAAAGEVPAEFIRLPEPAGLARLVRPAAPGAPLVVILPDALGEDGRSEAYVDSLLARGIATLALGLVEDADSSMAGQEPALSPAAVPVARAWAAAEGFGPTGLLGFGLGGRAALAGGLPAVALYAGCESLSAPAAPALLLQGADAAAACDTVPSGLTLRLIPGAGHGWDAPGALWPSPGPLLPDPAGGPRRLRARADLAVTLEAAETAADWFEDRLIEWRRAGR